MASCAMPGGCGKPTCYLCVELPKKFPPIERCEVIDEFGEQCKLVAGHRRRRVPCRFISHEKKERAEPKKIASRMRKAVKNQLR